MLKRAACILLAIVMVVALGLLSACSSAQESNSDATSPTTGPDLTPSTTGLSNPTTSISIAPWPQTTAYVPPLYPARSSSQVGYIDRTGNMVIEPQYFAAYRFSDGLAAVWVSGETGYIDETGTMIIAPDLGYSHPFSEGLAVAAAFEKGAQEKYGFIDKTGAWAIEPVYQWAGDFSEGLAAVGLEDGVGYIDDQGDLVFMVPTLSFAEYGREFHEGLAAVLTPLGYGYVDRTGRWIIEQRFFEATGFSGGVAVVGSGMSSYRIIDQQGQIVRQLKYVYARGFNDGRAVVELQGEDGSWYSGLYGYIDQTGELIIPGPFKSAEDFYGGLALVTELDGTSGYIDANGDYIWRSR